MCADVNFNEKYRNHFPYPLPGDIFVKEPKPGMMEMKRKFDEEDKRLISEFWVEVFDIADISNDHPKAELLRELSWDYGHSSGLNEVANYFFQLVELIRE